ncbi:hypothetical protein AU210_009514 [Fusarium oxysporum f. sp. radicis-cucumerinum]|uniref:Uncharacterized protein n=1 Tax=Fusarium oxysporum f. sp. radicis-cucumerinum TaxID=327505 RepID=A0A2H3GT32_FUSOX|nr:hypothetical protein AU210_009514 [Fusarium oxysporum f. sp. radicis-cucumerinum]
MHGVRFGWCGPVPQRHSICCGEHVRAIEVGAHVFHFVEREVTGKVNICRWYWRLMGMCPLRDLISCMMTISRDRILSKYKLHQLKTIDNCRPGC